MYVVRGVRKVAVSQTSEGAAGTSSVVKGGSALLESVPYIVCAVADSRMVGEDVCRS